jgi:hypothetical protein
MKWRYGIVKYRHELNKDHRFYGIGELYYEADPLKPFLCTDKPVQPFVEIDEEDNETPTEAMEKVLTMMLNDIKKYPPFDVDGPFEKEPDHHAEDWVDEFGTDEEPYAGHFDDYGLQEYYKSIEEGEDDGGF